MGGKPSSQSASHMLLAKVAAITASLIVDHDEQTVIRSIIHALTGLLRGHHQRLLAIQLACIDFLDEQIEALGTEITSCLADLSVRRS